MMRRSVSLVLAILALACFGFGESDNSGLAELQARAEKGEAVAQFLLGRAYLFATDGLKKDEAAAVVWFRKAAEQGQKNSETFLAWMYEEGRGGLAKDDTQAAVWYRKAAEQGEANAMRNLGLMCLDGRFEQLVHLVDPVQPLEALHGHAQVLARRGDVLVEQDFSQAALPVHLEVRSGPY